MSKIGFYPIVDSVAWVERLAPLNIQTLQLRIKNQSMSNVEHAIKESILIGRAHNCNLYINDYWELALKHQAHGVHVGQEDLDTTDIAAIHQAGLRLGISTHNEVEINRILEYQPYYLGFGPIYETHSKKIDIEPQGVERLKYWVEKLNIPIVAIGGITLSTVDDVLTANPDGVAVISAVTKAPDYLEAVASFKEMF